MAMFSLEDDDGNDLFITQESRELIPLFPSGLEEGNNEGNMCVESEKEDVLFGQYSDISDDEVFDIPSSQKQNSEKIPR